MNVDAMLRSITWAQFVEWKVFEELEPWAEERADYHAAHIVQTLWNIARDTKRHPDAFPLGDFLLAFGDMPVAVKPKQDVAQQEFLLDAWIAGNNAIVAVQEANRQ